MLNSLQNGRSSFIFTTLLVDTTTPSISTKKTVPLLQTIFTFLFNPYLFAKSSLLSPLRLHFSIFQQLFTSQKSRPKFVSLSQPFSQRSLRQGTRGLGSLVRTNTVLISLFFLKVWTVITGLTTTGSLTLRL